MRDKRGESLSKISRSCMNTGDFYLDGSGLQHHLPSRALLRADDHGFGAGQMFDSRFAEPGFFHPSATIRARIVESAGRFNEHREAQQQPERIFAAFVVNDPFKDQEDAALGHEPKRRLLDCRTVSLTGKLTGLEVTARELQ